METKDWRELIKLTKGSTMTVERVRIVESGIAIEGNFELPALANLSMDDQVFVVAFIRAEGVIKEMERTFGVSYPTIKGRLSRIVGQLQLVENVKTSNKQEIIQTLERGEITVDEAIERLSK
jgi:hypothetical protein